MATPTTDPGIPESSVFYFTTRPGTYTNFNNIEVSEEGTILYWKDNTWTKTSIINQVISYSNSKVNEYISELFIITPNGGKVDGIYVSFLQYTASRGFTFTLSKEGADIARIFRIKNLSAGDVIEIPIVDEAYSDYRFLLVYKGNTTEYGNSGIFWYLTDSVFNLLCWPVINNYLSSKIVKRDSVPIENSKNFVESGGVYSFIAENVNPLKNEISKKQDEPVVCTDDTANKYIIEMYIESGYKDDLYLSGIEFTDSTTKFTIYDSNGLVAFVSMDSSIVANTVYRFENDAMTLYWVWSGLRGLAISGIQYKFTDKVKSPIYWPYISAYIQEHKDDYTVKFWTNNTQCNNHIKELYINPEYFISGLKLKLIVVRQEKVQFGFYDSSDNLIYINSCQWPTVPTINNEIPYDDLIWPIYTSGIGGKLIGYIKFRYLNDNYGVSGINYTLTQSIVTNIDNSPTIKAIYNAKDQFVMFGDSLLGYPINTVNLMIPYLINTLKMPVYVVACGGCRMSLRKSDGSNYYDSFSFTKMVDAFISGELDANQQNPTGETVYTDQIKNLQLIDKTKNITAICEYLVNDFNSENLLGDYFVANTEVFNIDSFDKQTVLGAMNYGVSKLLMNLPEIKFGMVNGIYNIANNKIESLNDFKKEIDGNKTLLDYQEAIFTNATKIGIPYVDMNNMATGRNFFNLRMSDLNTVDGTHFNAYGFIQIAKIMVKVYEHISGNRVIN